MTRKIAFFTLGCKVNQSESQRMLDEFLDRGWQAVEFDQPADAYIINTCTVTQAADQKSRKMIRAAKRHNPAAVLAVTGCYAETGAEALKEIQEIDLIISNKDKDQAARLVEEALASPRKEGMRPDSGSAEGEEGEAGFPPQLKGLNRARVTLKIQDGCRQFCTYCVIPYARGGWQSLGEERVLAEAGRLAGAGAREIVLLGIHLGAYGWERGKKNGLAEILEKLLIAYPKTRFRLGSLEPMEAAAELIRLIQDYPNACKHLHLPLQCGQDRILKAMNRPYNTGDYRLKASEIRRALPDIALTTDIMTGFPGETDEEFEECYAFAREMAFSRIHVFAYSRRPGTPAASLPGQLPRRVKEDRGRRLIGLSEAMGREYALGWKGRTQLALAEEELSPGLWRGHSDNYLEVTFYDEGSGRQSRDLRGKLIPVVLTGEPGAREGSWAGRLSLDKA